MGSVFFKDHIFKQIKGHRTIRVGKIIRTRYKIRYLM